MSENSGNEVRVPWVGPTSFGWTPRDVAGGVVVHVAGELDLSTSAELRQRLMAVVGSAPAVVVLDLSELLFIDAHSIGLIMTAWRTARSGGRRLEVDGLRGEPARLFGVLGLEPLLTSRVCEHPPGGQARGRSGPTGDVVAWRCVGGVNGPG